MIGFKGLLTRYAVAFALLAALLFWTFGRIDGMLAAKDAATSDASVHQLAQHPALQRFRARLAQVEAAKVAVMRAQHQTADSLRLALQLGQRVDTVVVLQEIARADSTAYASCSVALSACEQRAASAEREADSLAARLTAQLRVGKCRILFLPCPSRTAMFFIGGALGAAAAVKLK
jgi:hypothetical protein